MPKANRTCYCCGRGYYYCPSCYDENRDPKIYIMFDSEKCMDIFNTLTDESTHVTTTQECKEKLIKMGVNKSTKLADPIRKHVDRVMAYEEISEENTQTDITKVYKNTKKIEKQRTRKSSLNTENSEVI